MKQVRRKLTYANLMSSLAVFLVVGGGVAVAAGGLGRNTVGTPQLKRNAVTAAKIKRGAVTGAKVKLSTLGTVPDSRSLGGLPAAKYAIRSAVVLGKGTIVAAHSDGVKQANVTHPNTGLYCFKGLSPAPRTAVAQLYFEADFKSEIFVAVKPTEGGCKGAQAAVATEKSGGGFVDEPFAVIIH
jgi:hypothetical protein